MIVFQDMVNAGKYDFLRDTALPTLGLWRRDDRKLHTDPLQRRNFLAAMEGTVRQLGNHPCIVLWTIFNEGWGQFCADDAYDRLKALDPSRFIDTASGWFVPKKTDAESLHIYFRPPRTGKDRTRPQILSEYGGYAFKLPEHSFNTEKTYGYRKYADAAGFERALVKLTEELIPLAERGLCAAVYTQLSDVEDETNGLVTFDRRERKISPEKLRRAAEKLKNTVK